MHLDTLMPYRVIHVDTPFTSAWSFYICDHLKQWDPTIDLLAVLDLCPLFCSTSVLSIKVRQHWKETPKTKKHSNWQKSLRTLHYTINMPISCLNMFEIVLLSLFKNKIQKNLETSHVQRERLNFLGLCLWHQGIQRFTKPRPHELPILIAMSSTGIQNWRVGGFELHIYFKQCTIWSTITILYHISFKKLNRRFLGGIYNSSFELTCLDLQKISSHPRVFMT